MLRFGTKSLETGTKVEARAALVLIFSERIVLGKEKRGQIEVRKTKSEMI